MSRKKIILQVIFLILVMSMTLYTLFKDEGFYSFLRTLNNVKLPELIVSFILLLAYILLESVIIKIILYTLGEPIAITKCMKYSFIGFFFYCITPAGSAEQPMQLICMHRDGINISKSVVSLVLITITFKLSIIMLGGCIYIFRPKDVIRMIDPIDPLCILGIILSLAAVVFLLCVLFLPEIADKVISKCISAAAKLKILKDEQKWNRKKTAFIGKYSETLELCKGHKLMPIAVLAITIVQRLCYMGITAASCRALDIHTPSIMDITAVQGMIQLATDMLPLPGGLGVNEWLYMKAFSPSFKADTLSTLILSRGIGFYCQLILCGLVSGIIWLSEKKKAITRL